MKIYIYMYICRKLIYIYIFIFEYGRGGASGEYDAQEKENRESPMDITIFRNFRFPREWYKYIYI